MSTFEDQAQVGQRRDTPTPTIVLQLIEGKLVMLTGPHPVCSETYNYGWDETWQESSADIESVTVTIDFRRTVSTQPIMVQRCLDFVSDDPAERAESLGLYLWEVLNGKDPR